MTVDTGEYFALEFGRKKRRAKLSLAPLIDVTFILLIFFMLVSQFTRLAPLDVSISSNSVDPAQREQVIAAKGEALRAVLKLHAGGGFMVNGKHHDAALGLQGAVDLIKVYFDEVKSAREESGSLNPMVLLDPDPDVTLQQLIDALTILKKSPEFTVNVLAASPVPATYENDAQ